MQCRTTYLFLLRLTKQTKENNMYIDTYTSDQLNNSFDFLENFIKDKVRTWDTAPNTSLVENQFSQSIQSMGNLEFSLLILHAGYIPEFYLPDSSQETLYSKLIESLVCEWAKRIGFQDSFLQTQKSNKEDVTIKKGNSVIVCDAKSFRLGRSQAAPNVKDTIKKQAYTTWLEQYNCDKVGGLVTFPSLHDWKKGSEAYSYFTEGNPAIMMLFYEQMSYMLVKGITHQKMIDFLKNYSAIYPNASKDRNIYWKGVKRHLLTPTQNDAADYNRFMAESETIIKMKVNHVLSQLASYLIEKRSSIEYEVDQLSIEDLKTMAVEAKYHNLCADIERQQDNIIRFRPHD